MKKLLVPVLCVLLGCVGGAAMGSVMAQTVPGPVTVPRWQQECEWPSAGLRPERVLGGINEVVRRRGQGGWELVSHSDNVLCFKRPAP